MHDSLRSETTVVDNDDKDSLDTITLNNDNVCELLLFWLIVVTLRQMRCVMLLTIFRLSFGVPAQPKEKHHHVFNLDTSVSRVFFVFLEGEKGMVSGMYISLLVIIKRQKST